MYILIIVLPFLGFLLSGLFGRFFGRLGSAFISTFNLFLTFLLSLFIFYEVVLCHSLTNIILYNWILFDIYNISFGLYFDSLSSIMIVVVTSISLLVHLYSISYMSHDLFLARFMSFLSFFTFFMLILITANNFLQMFIGWEGVGLCSYLLINFWFTRILANKAALKAMIINRIADVFFIIAILLIFLNFKTLDYIIVFNLIPFILNKTIIFFNISFLLVNLISFFLFIGAIGKSAQIGLHTWLPDAMEGPTPVSALLHAATMVTAGVFLVIRCSFFFEHSEFMLLLLLLFGGITAIFAGLVALFQYDIKKIIAYSTCSQLGYMFFSCGLSNYDFAIFHLFNHAFFKALLFLSAGSVIHALFDEQDIRRMGQLYLVLPFTYFCFFVSSLAIMGFPFLTGFFSKDIILELTYSRFIIDSLFIYFLGLFAAILTASYSIRLIIFVFFQSNSTKMYKTYYSFMHNNIIECNWPMFIPMLILSIFSIFIGFFFSDLFVGWGSPIWMNSIYLLPKHFSLIHIEFIHPIVKNLPVILSLLFCYWTKILISYFNLFLFSEFFNTRLYNFIYLIWYNLSSFFYHANFFNKIYNDIFIYLFIISYSSVNKFLDKGLFEYYGPFGFYKFVYYLFSIFEPSKEIIIFFVLLLMILLIILFIVLFIHLLSIIHIGAISYIFIYIYLYTLNQNNKI